MAEKKGKSTAVPAQPASAETAQASAPATKVRRPAMLAGKDQVPAKPASVFAGSISRAVTQ
ncbi:MAG: hypothetical protein II515_04325, partial [Desulfovibrio sp.]|nr:hypothetical protein [Desulfovibrio sp.]